MANAQLNTMKRVLPIALAAATLAAAAVAEAHTTTYETAATARTTSEGSSLVCVYYTWPPTAGPCGPEHAVEGQVSSTRKACANRRVVALYRTHAGGTRLVSKARSRRAVETTRGYHSGYRFGVGRVAPPAGEYHVEVVPRTSVGGATRARRTRAIRHKHTCGRARSDSVRFGPLG